MIEKGPACGTFFQPGATPFQPEADQPLAGAKKLFLNQQNYNQY